MMISIGIVPHSAAFGRYNPLLVLLHTTSDRANTTNRSKRSNEETSRHMRQRLVHDTLQKRLMDSCFRTLYETAFCTPVISHSRVSPVLFNHRAESAAV